MLHAGFKIASKKKKNCWLVHCFFCYILADKHNDEKLPKIGEKKHRQPNTIGLGSEYSLSFQINHLKNKINLKQRATSLVIVISTGFYMQ